MKFKDVNEFKTYLEDKLSSKEVLKQHLNVFEDSREMIDINKDKTNLTWDWMENNTIYLVRSNSAGVLTYLYAPKIGEKESYEDSGVVKELKKIFYAQKNNREVKQDIKDSSSDFKFGLYSYSNWDASTHEAQWVQAILEIKLGDKLFMNWSDVPWSDVK
jgi:hypothetical protein